jgi:hypothetical protein
MKLKLLINATVVDDAIRFVEQGKEILKLTNEKDSQESEEHDYDDKQREQIDEIHLIQ